MTKAGAPPGTKAGTMAGDLAGQRTDVTVPKQTLQSGGTIGVGTIETNICTIPLKGIEIVAPVLKGNQGGTTNVNVALDSNEVLISDQVIKSPGATLTVSPDQYRQAADKQTHKIDFHVNKLFGKMGATLEVTPTITGLSAGGLGKNQSSASPA